MLFLKLKNYTLSSPHTSKNSCDDLQFSLEILVGNKDFGTHGLTAQVSKFCRAGQNVFVCFFNKCIYFIYLFLAALGLHCCPRAFSSCGERGLLFVVVHGLLIAVASLVTEHGL